jgi:hypothetical protein
VHQDETVDEEPFLVLIREAEPEAYEHLFQHRGVLCPVTNPPTNRPRTPASPLL